MQSKRRIVRWLAGSLGGLTLGAACLFMRGGPTGIESPVHAQQPAGGGAAAPAAPAVAAAQVPVKEVVVYSSGVTYYERAGTVKGDASLELKFKVGDINDLLKSMVVQDLGGGQVSTVTYGSRDPLTKALRSFAVDLTGNPTMGMLLNQVRGEKVEIAAPPATLIGTIIGVEKQRVPSKDGPAVEVDILNVLTADGLRSIPFSQVQRVKLLNQSLDAELQQALAVLAGSHDTQKKTVGLTFTGQGERPVRVGYVVESPIWKTSYRLLVSGEKAPFLQGWAIIENTTDDDWSNVNLTLVSGRPISFIQDLYQSLYVPRPIVEPELYASLRPPTYDPGMAPSPAAPPAARAMERAEKSDYVRGDGKAAGGFGGEARRELLQRGRAFDALSEGVASQATGAQTGELFSYNIRRPVTLPRQKSAMIPIVNNEIEGKRVSIYNERVQNRHPLYGLRLKNTSGLHLMQGPITVFADGVYGGDARIEDLKPGEERLISYGIDLGVRVEPVNRAGAADMLSASIRRGTMSIKRRYEEGREYNIVNADQKARTVLIEHAFRPTWKLLEPKQEPERTPNAYRFPVQVAGGASAKLTVREEHQVFESVAITNLASDSIQYYIRSTVVSPAVKAALEKIVVMKDRLTVLARERAAIEQRINEITVEQDRIRRNMAGLPQTNELFIRYVKKLDEQETEIEKLRKDLAAKRLQEETARRDLDGHLLSLDVQ